MSPDLRMSASNSYQRDINNYHNCTAAIFFADIIDSVHFSDVLMQSYYDLIYEYHKVAHDIIDRFIFSNYPASMHSQFAISIKGDEVCIIAWSNPEKDARTLLQIAMELKLQWLLSQFNRKRILEGHDPVNLSMGLHFGNISLGDFSCLPDSRHSPEGQAISVAKRIEGSAKQGGGQILMSETFMGKCGPVRTEEIDLTLIPSGTQKFKGNFMVDVHKVKYFWRWDWKNTITEDQLQLIEKLFNLHPQWLWTGNIAGPVRWKKEQYPQAQEIYAKLTKYDDKNATLLYDLGLIAYEHGLTIKNILSQRDILINQACNYFLQASNLEPNDPDILRMLYQSYCELKDYKKAKEILKTIIRIDPADKTSFKSLIKIYIDQGLFADGHKLARDCEFKWQDDNEFREYQDICRRRWEEQDTT